jgi:hypothetical protein
LYSKIYLLFFQTRILEKINVPISLNLIRRPFNIINNYNTLGSIMKIKSTKVLFIPEFYFVIPFLNSDLSYFTAIPMIMYLADFGINDSIRLSILPKKNLCHSVLPNAPKKPTVV